jgi:hypothetical protein
MEQHFKIELFIDKRPNGILQPNGTLGIQNHSDFYINVPLNRDITLFEDYVNIAIDPFRTMIERQLINPYFIELGFFETVNSVTASTKTLSPIIDKAKQYDITINK